jgi:ABC-2 type transport system ATP-binding protein
VLEMGTVEELVSNHFRERAVRFDSDAGLEAGLLQPLPGVTSVAIDDTDTLVYTSDVGATIGALLTAAESRGVEPQNLAIRRASLEDVFLALTGRALRD